MLLKSSALLMKAGDISAKSGSAPLDVFDPSVIVIIDESVPKFTVAALRTHIPF